jgi:hypothetical protein
LYKKKTGKQFINFLKRVEKRYDDKNIQNIFLVLDNLSVHKSKKYKKSYQTYPRIKLVFLPVRAPTELNLIEDGCGYKDKQLTILHSKMSKKW